MALKIRNFDIISFVILFSIGIDVSFINLDQSNEMLTIFRYLKPLAAILDAILKITDFQKSDFGKLLVCHSACLKDTDSVKKSLVAICLRSNPIFTGLYIAFSIRERYIPDCMCLAP